MLDAFLDRCGLKVPNHSNLVSYKDFLMKFQSRSDNGIAYHFIREGYLIFDSDLVFVDPNKIDFLLAIFKRTGL